MMNPGPTRLYAPKLAPVRVREDGTPVAFGGVAVETVREDWLVEDRWWTPDPLRRRYFELALADGRDVVVFRSGGEWFVQRA